MTVLRKRQQPLLDDPDDTYLARAAAEEAKHDWHMKPRAEKVRLARAEMRRRKGRRQVLGITWTKEVILITIIGFVALVTLLYLLTHGQVQNQRGFRHHGSWLDRMENAMGI